MSSLAPRKEARKVVIGRSGGGNGALTQRVKRRERRRKGQRGEGDREP